jgi:integral membrane protein (TIGR01906 family)
MEKEVLHKLVTVLVILLALSTTVMIYLSNAKAIALDQDIYEKEFDKYNIHQRFNTTTNLTKETTTLITYLESGDGTIQSDFFNQKEKTHLVEVRDLFKLLTLVLNIIVIISAVSLFLLLISLRHFSALLTHAQGTEYVKRLISNLLIGIGAAVDAIAVLFAVMAFTFTSSFILFHKLFFRTDTWILNPATDNLIRMFPEPFFFDLFTRIILMSIVFATILLVIGFVMKLGVPKMLQRK